MLTLGTKRVYRLHSNPNIALQHWLTVLHTCIYTNTSYGIQIEIQRGSPAHRQTWDEHGDERLARGVPADWLAYCTGAGVCSVRLALIPCREAETSTSRNASSAKSML